MDETTEDTDHVEETGPFDAAQPDPQPATPAEGGPVTEPHVDQNPPPPTGIRDCYTT